MIEYVAGIGDPRLSAYSGMTDMDARLRREGAEGFYMAEGATVISRALACGHEIVSTLSLARWTDDLVACGVPEGTPMYIADEDTLHATTGFHVHRGALAVFRRPRALTVHDVVQTARLVLVLEDLVDHANVGAAFRSAGGLGVDAVVLSPRCADPLYRRAIKTSMGATLSVPWARAEAWPDALSVLRESGFSVWGLTPRDGSVTLESAVASASPPVALVVGTEGTGMAETSLDACSLQVQIPMHNEVDSLNVAAASAVAIYAVASRLPREVV